MLVETNRVVATTRSLTAKWTEQEARDWLTANHPIVRLVKWGGKASARSIFIREGREFSRPFATLKFAVNNGRDVGVKQFLDIQDVVARLSKTDYELVEYAGAVHLPSSFRRTSTGVMFTYSFQDLEDRIKSGAAAGVGAGWNKTSEHEAKFYLAEFCPWIELVSWGGACAAKSVFLNKELGVEFTATLNNIKLHPNPRLAGAGDNPNRMTEEDLSLWLKENYPAYEVAEFGGSSTKISKFREIRSGRTFRQSAHGLQRTLEKGGTPGVGSGQYKSKEQAQAEVDSLSWRPGVFTVLSYQKYVKKAEDRSHKTCTLLFYIDGKKVEMDYSFSGLVQSLKKNPHFVPGRGTSSLEHWCMSILDSNHLEYAHNKKLPGSKYRPDFYLPTYNLVIELDGTYYHSDAKLGSTAETYHTRKRQAYLDKGVTSLFFREDEINEKHAIVESILLARVGVYSREIDPRRGSIKEIDPSFFTANHLGGPSKGTCFGIVYNGEVVAGIQLSKGKQLKVTRFCTILNTRVPNALARLLKHVEGLYNPESVEISIDNRYEAGTELVELGFTHKIDTKPDFQWTKGYHKLYDCGRGKYVRSCL